MTTKNDGASIVLSVAEWCENKGKHLWAAQLYEAVMLQYEDEGLAGKAMNACWHSIVQYHMACVPDKVSELKRDLASIQASHDECAADALAEAEMPADAAKKYEQLMTRYALLRMPYKAVQMCAKAVIQHELANETDYVEELLRSV